MIEFKEYDKVDSMEWLFTTAFAEGSNALNVINDEELWDIGDWGTLTFIEMLDVDDVVARCMVNEGELYGFIVYPNKQNKGYGKLLFEYCMDNHSKDDKMTLSTSNKYMESIIKKYKHKMLGLIDNEYGGPDEPQYEVYKTGDLNENNC